MLSRRLEPRLLPWRRWYNPGYSAKSKPVRRLRRGFRGRIADRRRCQAFGDRYWRDQSGRFAVQTPSGRWHWMVPTLSDCRRCAGARGCLVAASMVSPRTIKPEIWPAAPILGGSPPRWLQGGILDKRSASSNPGRSANASSPNGLHRRSGSLKSPIAAGFSNQTY
jgi:hypothetical protein